MIPQDATFRRAEGLTFAFHPCDGMGSAEMFARRQGGMAKRAIDLDDVRLIMRLSRWQTAEELGVAHERLVQLVDVDALFWSRGRPDRDLTGEPLAALEGTLALRDNVSPAPSVVRVPGAEPEQFPHMPHMGELDKAQMSGTVLITAEHDMNVGSVSFSCCPRHVALVRDLVVRLDGRHEVASFGAEERAVLQVMNDCGLLERRVAPAWDGEARVTWLVHAAVLYEAARRRIVVDPISMHPRSRPTRHVPQPYDLRDLGPLDAVLITHGDFDHLNPNVLHRVDRRTPIVIPRVHRVYRYHVEMRKVLELLGFEKVIEVDEWERLQFGDVTVVVTPFRGEDWGLSLPCRTYLIHSDELTIYCNADSTSTPEAYDRLAEEFAVDVAFVGVTGNEESHVMPPGYGYGDFYARWIPRERHNEWVHHCNGPRESAEVARRLRAKYAFGYAAGGATYFPVAYSDRGSHAELARWLEGGPTRPLDLKVGVPARVR